MYSLPFGTILGTTQEAMPIGNRGYHGTALVNTAALGLGLLVGLFLGIDLRFRRGGHGIFSLSDENFLANQFVLATVFSNARAKHYVCSSSRTDRKTMWERKR